MDTRKTKNNSCWIGVGHKDAKIRYDYQRGKDGVDDTWDIIDTKTDIVLTSIRFWDAADSAEATARMIVDGLNCISSTKHHPTETASKELNGTKELLEHQGHPHTVVGYYVDNDQVFVEFVFASRATEAAIAASKRLASDTMSTEPEDDEALSFARPIAVFRGHLTPHLVNDL